MSWGGFAAALIAIGGALVPSTGEGSDPVVPVMVDGPEWTVEDASPSGSPFVEIDGRRAIHLRRGVAVFERGQTRDGVLEADLRPTAANGGFLGLAFRVQSREHFELVYVRFGHSGQADAVQYDPFLNGSITWQLHPEAQAAAALPSDRWTHLRIVFAGTRAKIFVGDASKPTLVVPNLSEMPVSGKIGVFSLADGGYVSNLRLTPLVGTAGPSATPAPAKGTIVDWQVSPSLDVRKIDPSSYPATDNWTWRDLRSDPSGILVVNRIYASYTGFPPTRADIEARRAPGRLVFARATIRSDRPRVRALDLGYSDNVTVFLNGRPLYTGANALGYREAGHAGRISLSDKVALPLRAGRNELMVALSDYGGGWGMQARLEP
ncbi:MAG: hypothetical protein E7773_14900 [Sphingomonas sp.]|uniref:hypothetical protein n=1 Tax=Sphingomonas sp. TaxID=28214 RepID=UPI0011F6F04C|nr:hypothetical protein [Sphingomonas sp.]THD34475.1 MAG: hypothetical protein E7773_14900 [Sphingomonas sp.]